MRPADAGFEPVQQRRDGSTTYSKREHPFLVFFLTVRPDSTATLSWELALGEYLTSKAMTFSAQDALSLFVFGEDRHGPATIDWLNEQVDQVLDQLKQTNLATGE